MRAPRDIILTGLLIGVLAAGIGAGTLVAYVSWYAGTDRLFPGVVVGNTPVGGLQVAQARSRLSGAGTGAGASSAAPGWAGAEVVPGAHGSPPPAARPAPAATPQALRLKWEGQEWLFTRAEVGPTPDVDGALKTASALGRSGSALSRARIYLDGLVHGHRVPLESSLNEGAILRRLEDIAQEVNVGARDARYSPDTRTVLSEAPGRVVDLQASFDAVRYALRTNHPETDLVVRVVEPAVRRQDIAVAPPTYQIARFATPVLAAEPGRVQNIKLAIQKINGTVLLPGQVFSFNDTVGPRDAARGWAPAKELYQGEFVMGYGGGICQVSSTLYNTVLLGGMEIRERYHHDRPLQYVAPGRDATVAWNVLDFKFRNTLSASVLLGARLVPGSPAQIEVSLRSVQAVPEGRIRLEDGDIRYLPPLLEESLDPALPVPTREVTDEGLYGIELKIYRIFRENGAERRELVSHDQYRPKPGRVRVGTGVGSTMDSKVAQ